MKRLIFITGLVIVGIILRPTFLWGQDNRGVLKIRLVSHEGANGQDDNLNKLLHRIISETNLSELYSDVDIRSSSYDDDISYLNEDAIVSFSPTKFSDAKNKLGDNIIPIFVVEKEKNANGVYYTQFITSLTSEITSIENDLHKRKIKKIYFVAKQSTSGYVYALKELQRLGLIKYVCDCVLVEKGIEVAFLEEHKFVQEAVSKNDYAIGAVWNADESKVKILHESPIEIPQDVIFISSNLKKYRETIKKWLKTNLAKYPEYFESSSNHIVGFIDYSDVWEYKYKGLFEAYQEVINTEKEVCGDELNFHWLRKNKSALWIALIPTFIVSVLIAIFTWIINLISYKCRSWRKKRKTHKA